MKKEKNIMKMATDYVEQHVFHRKDVCRDTYGRGAALLSLKGGENFNVGVPERLD